MHPTHSNGEIAEGATPAVAEDAEDPAPEAAEDPAPEAAEDPAPEATEDPAPEAEDSEAAAAEDPAPSAAEDPTPAVALPPEPGLMDAARQSLPFDPIAVTTPIRVALGLIYFHFGFLKFFPDLSAAEMLSTQTILRLRLGLQATDALAYLAVFECLIGLMFIARVPMKWLFPVFLAHMAGTLAPLVLLPQLTFKFAPFAPTLEGQYIMKNAVIIAAGWTLYRADRARESALQPPADEVHGVQPSETRSAAA